MDFKDTPEEGAFRAEARAWLQANAPVRGQTAEQGPDDEDNSLVKRAKAWQLKKAEAGYGAITWPKEFGGRGGKPMEQVIWNQEQSKFDVPSGVYEIGLGMCIPVMLTYATDEQKERFALPALRGEEIWCQLFSEPGAGSDVAGIRMSAKRDGDDWIVNGQKVWTSGAHYSDWAILVTRSDPAAPKHKGLTFFFVDMKSPGIEARPIRQISGGANFNEVFFTDVRVPDSQRLGEVGGGWKVVITTLMHERASVGGSGLFGRAGVAEFLEAAKSVMLEDGPASEDKSIRRDIANWYVRERGLELTGYRALTALSKGETPGPENSIGKLVAAKQAQDMGTAAQDLAELAGEITDPEYAVAQADFLRPFYWGAGMRIAGGTDEIMRNIIAERVLGLPGDIRVDKDVPFNELPTGR